jgi:hypothetical protein
MTVQFMHASAGQTIINTNTNTPLTEQLLFIESAKATLVKCSQICLHTYIL